MSRQECETRFLSENLMLMAEKLEISKSEAILIQSKLWYNPTITIDQVNLWASKKNLGVFGDQLQGFNGGSVGKNQEFSVGIDQLIRTAGKRGKQIALNKVSIEKSKQAFEDLLRNLKLEFRSQLTQLQYLQLNRRIYQNEIESIKRLTAAYQRQLHSDNVSQGEYIRLKALELELTKNINELDKQSNEVESSLKQLMNIAAAQHLIIKVEDFQRSASKFETLLLSQLIDQAKLSRPDYKMAQLDEDYYNRLYNFEKAQRVPDLTLKGGYDRGGNFMYNFIGFGVAMDLPIYNRNQGNIKIAQAGIKQSRLMEQQASLALESEVALAFNNLNIAFQFKKEIALDYEAVLDSLLSAYTKNFTERNISMLEYLDFLNAYLDNKKIIVDTEKDINNKIEELNYTVGQDVL